MIEPTNQTGGRSRFPVLALLMLLFAGVVSFHEIDNYDTWINVKAGEYILENGEIPRTDVFSHTVPENEWVYHEWLSAVALELVHRTGGTFGLVLFTALIAIISFSLMLRLAYPTGGILIPSLIATVGMIAAAGRFSVRCHLFTLLFFSVFLFILENNRRNGTKWIFALVPLQLLWTNLHGGFALGIALIGAYLVGGIISSVPPFKKKTEDRDGASGYLKILAIVGVVCVGALFINPYGAKLALKPFLEFGSQELTGGINEWAPPLEYTPFPPILVLFYKVCLGIAGISLLFLLIPLRPTHVLLLVALGYLSFSARRHIAVFALALVPIASESFAGCRSWLLAKLGEKSFFKGLRFSLGTISGLAILAMSTGYVLGHPYRLDHLPTRFGSAPCPLIQPVAALDFLKEKGVTGEILNNYSVGGYIAYRLFPEHKVFLDGRNVMYGDFLAEYDQLLEQPAEVFPRFEEQFGIGTVVLRLSSPGVPGLLSYLSRRDDFSLAYYDQVAAIFLRGEHETVKGNALVGEKKDNRYPVGKLALGQLYVSQRKFDEAIEQLTLATEWEYPVPEAHFALGSLYRAMMKMPEAEAEMQKALAIQPRWVEAHFTLAKILLQKSPPYLAEAETHLLACLDIDPKSVQARLEYAILLATSQEADKAQKILLDLVSEYPKDVSLLYTLGQLQEGRRRPQEAKATYQKVLELDANHYFSYYALGAIFFQERDWEGAKTLAKKALELKPNDPKSERMIEECTKKQARNDAASNPSG